jgi:predicted secreted protein
MTQTPSLPAPSLAWCQALQAKLMAALDAAWAILEHSEDPAEIKRARDKAKSIGDLAAMARKVALIVPMAKAAPARATDQALAPIAAQAEHARRALDKLKGGGRARL